MIFKPKMVNFSPDVKNATDLGMKRSGDRHDDEWRTFFVVVIDTTGLTHIRKEQHKALRSTPPIHPYIHIP